MRDHEWSLLDALAHELSSNDVNACRQELSNRLKKAEATLINIFKLMNVILGVLIGIVGVIIVISIIALAVSRSDAALIFGTISWPLSSFGVIYLVSRLWRYPGLEFLLPKVLRDPRLAVFRDHLNQMANGDIEVWDKYDRRVAPAFLNSAWTVLIYSEREEARAIPISSRFQTYPDGLLTRRPVQQSATLSAASETLGMTASAPTSSPETGNNRMIGSRSDSIQHWLSDVEESDFYRLLKEICAQWDGIKSQQTEAMLKSAYEYARKHPNVSVAELRRVATSALKSKRLPIGLDGGDSDIWISRMLGREKVHKYRFVRLHFTDPNYQLRNGLNDQMGFEL